MLIKKGVVLVVVIGVLLVLSILALVAVNLMSQESRIAEHKIRRIRAFYAAQAGEVDGLERLRRGTIALPTPGNPTIYTINIGAGLVGYPAAGYPVNIRVTVRGDISDPDPAFRCPAGAPSNFCVFCTVTNY
jgi:Tfp pilus assembly protein PilX